ncbi:MAG: hypothetical protein K0S39_576 [Paenibacillus sp.]|jgi:siderophore synthetase component|nr:hypothetical protein [Paenibacillus sp.]
MLHNYEFLSAETGTSQRLAEHAALRGLLNCYLRETGIFDPRKQTDSRDVPVMMATGHAEDGFEILRQLYGKDSSCREAFVLTLPLTKVSIAGRLVYYSMTGQHQYGESFFAADGYATVLDFAKAGFNRLIDMLLMEVSFNEPESVREVRRSEMRGQIENSIRRTALYLANALDSRLAESWRPLPLDYTRSEQSLLFGHPFHPTPKSSEGFADPELRQYAPETGASFSLYYMAVSNELILEEWVDAPPAAVPAVLEAARQKLGSRVHGYSLLPVHPWQAAYLSRQSTVRKLIKQGKLVDLGAIGQTVYPTSSVRTVWDPENRVFYKLPLHVRITNFIRENTTEQVRRTMDAALVLHLVLKQRQAQKQRAGTGAGAAVWTAADVGMIILPETGYRTVEVPGIPALEQEQLKSGFAVIWRQAEQLTTAEQEGCFVTASLLEQPPGREEPLLFQAVRQSSKGQLPDWPVWLASYLELSMLPLLRLLAETGVSLEAHVQNSLLTLERGMPVRYYVRDLEGISIDRETAARQGWTPGLIPGDSPVLYSEAECWKRLKYYFFVNHLGAMIHTIARFNQTDESVYWNTVRSLLQTERRNSLNYKLNIYVNDLLNGTGLPAKANFISRFQGRGETPDYVEIPNPIYYCGVSE